MASEIAVNVRNVSKNFILPYEKIGSMKALFTNILRRNTKRQREMQHALRDITFDVKRGEFFGILGRNGSGKSTLLKILAGIYQPTQGSVTTEGKLVPFIELGVGFNPELTGRDNVFLNGALLGFSHKEVESMYDDIVAFAELEDFMDQKLKNYSSGMQVRLAFSMATRAKADILLIDEVLAVGDADFQRKCFQYFRGLKKDNTTVVFVSHDMEAVREYCDRCVVIDQAQIAYEGSPEVAAEKYVKLFNQSVTEKSSSQQSDGQRWGDGSARVAKVRTKIDSQEVSIRAEVDFLADMDEPIFGFLIKNSSGVTICGSNSRILRTKLGSYKQGDRTHITCTVPNIFGDDAFSVEVAVTHKDGITQADWWHAAASFENRNQHSTPHIVSPSMTMKVETSLKSN